MSPSRTIPIVTALAALALAVAMPAHAAEPPSAVAQYIEQIPTASGSVVGPLQRGSAAPLPRSVDARLESEAGAEAPLLRDVATSPRYGAPTRTLPGPLPAEPDDEGLVLGVAVAATSEGDSRWLAVVLIGVPAITIVLAALVRARRLATS
jgi:hypothetical protein